MKVLVASFPDGVIHTTSSLCDSMKAIGHEVQRFIYTGLNRDSLVYTSKIPGIRGMHMNNIKSLQRKENEQLIKKSEKFQPDVLISIKGEAIFPETIEKIRKETGAFSILWAIDDPNKFLDESKALAPGYDFVFTSGMDSKKEYAEIGVRAEYIPFAADHRIFREMDVNENDRKIYGSDISFVARRRKERVELVNNIADTNLKVWGPRWKNWFRFFGCDRDYKIYNKGLLDKCTGKSANTDMYLKIINASKINLNSHARNWKMKSNIRSFEIALCNAFLLSDNPEGFKDLFRVGKEVVCFNDGNELKELCQYYLDNEDERRKVAKAGYERALKEHTLDIRAKEMLGVVKS